MHRVVEVVRPVGVETVSAHFPSPHPARVVGVDFRDHECAPAQGVALRVDRLADLLRDVHRTQIHDPVGGVEPKPVQVILGDPVDRVVHDVATDLVAVRSVEVEPVPPRRLIAVREIRTQLGEVVPLRAEMVVHHVEQHGEARTVCGVDQALEAVRPAVGALHRVRETPS